MDEAKQIEYPFNKYWKCSTSTMLKEIYLKEFEAENGKDVY
ncbi:MULTISPECIES: hypothetical protein [Lysinibacillus]|nr:MULTISPECIES: hypothetical protein [Lysinibacillus]